MREVSQNLRKFEEQSWTLAVMTGDCTWKAVPELESYTVCCVLNWQFFARAVSTMIMCDVKVIPDWQSASTEPSMPTALITVSAVSDLEHPDVLGCYTLTK